jgi:hypothetical protein
LDDFIINQKRKDDEIFFVKFMRALSGTKACEEFSLMISGIYWHYQTICPFMLEVEDLRGADQRKFRWF